MRERIEALERELAKLKAQLVEKYEPKLGEYYIYGNGVIRDIFGKVVEYTAVGRAFDTKEKAEKARDIMVKHDIILKYVIDHDPDYEFDEKNLRNNYYLTYFNGKWTVGSLVQFYHFGTVYMPRWVAEKLVDDLNNNRIDGI